MKKYGRNCIAKIKKLKHTGEDYEIFDNIIQKDWSTKKPMEKLITNVPIAFPEFIVISIN